MFEGSPSDPLSLHKYHYGNSDGVNNADPSGYITLAELNVAMANQRTINGTRTTGAIKTRNKVVKKLSCEVGVAYIKNEFDRDSMPGFEGHHSIPQNLGGNLINQKLLFLPAETHRTFHWVLNVLLKSEPQFKGMGNWTSATKWETISQTKAGRRALYEVIHQSSILVDKFCELKRPRSLRYHVEQNKKAFIRGY